MKKIIVPGWEGRDGSHSRERPSSSCPSMALKPPGDPHPFTDRVTPALSLSSSWGGSLGPPSKQVRPQVCSMPGSGGTQDAQTHFSSSLGPGQASPPPRRKEQAPNFRPRLVGGKVQVVLSCRGGCLHQASSVLTHLMSRIMASMSSTRDWSLWKILARGFLV